MRTRPIYKTNSDYLERALALYNSGALSANAIDLATWVIASPRDWDAIQARHPELNGSSAARLSERLDLMRPALVQLQQALGTGPDTERVARFVAKVERDMAEITDRAQLEAERKARR